MLVIVYYSVILFPSPPSSNRDAKDERNVLLTGPLAIGLATLACTEAGGGGKGGPMPLVRARKHVQCLRVVAS